MKKLVLVVMISFGFVNSYGLSYQEIKSKFQKAQTNCSQNDGRACYELGNFYEYSYRYEASKNNFVEFMQTDCATAIAYYEKSCSLNDFMGCAYMGYVYERGGCYKAEEYVPRDLYKAKAYFSKSCKLSNYSFDRACIQVDTLERLGIR